MSETSEPGLNALEVTVALLHATALALVTLALALAVFGRRPEELPFAGVSPRVAIVTGAFLGWFVALLVPASRRPPRATLGGGARALLVVSGLVAGFLGLPLLLS